MKAARDRGGVEVRNRRCHPTSLQEQRLTTPQAVRHGEILCLQIRRATRAVEGTQGRTCRPIAAEQTVTCLLSDADDGADFGDSPPLSLAGIVAFRLGRLSPRQLALLATLRLAIELHLPPPVTRL